MEVSNLPIANVIQLMPEFKFALKRRMAVKALGGSRANLFFLDCARLNFPII